MKPLIVLLAVFVIMLLAGLLLGHPDAALAGRVAMAVMLLFTSIAHFAFARGMQMMLPDAVPFKKILVYVTGLLEIAFAAGLLLPDCRVLCGWLLIAFFVLMLPANIYAALRKVDYEKATYAGKGTSYLWFRVPLQLLFITWVYFSAIVY